MNKIFARKRVSTIKLDVRFQGWENPMSLDSVLIYFFNKYFLGNLKV